jgi:thioredoxin reductase (NADPH)
MNNSVAKEARVLDVKEGSECIASRKREWRDSDALFAVIGAQAETSWLPERIVRNRWGYICTGRDAKDLLGEREADAWPLERDPFLLETSVPGIFAAGVVRNGSIKRVASSVSAGSMAIAFPAVSRGNC